MTITPGEYREVTFDLTDADLMRLSPEAAAATAARWADAWDAELASRLYGYVLWRWVRQCAKPDGGCDL